MTDRSAKADRTSEPSHMKRFGEVAVRATEVMHSGAVTDIQEAWDTAAKLVFPQSESSQGKSCPRGAYLGLCERGLVAGIRAATEGAYTKSAANKEYAIKAVNLLKQDAALALLTPEMLWQRVMAGEEKHHNSQMDVVLALWHRGFIA